MIPVAKFLSAICHNLLLTSTVFSFASRADLFAFNLILNDISSVQLTALLLQDLVNLIICYKSGKYHFFSFKLNQVLICYTT